MYVLNPETGLKENLEKFQMKEWVENENMSIFNNTYVIQTKTALGLDSSSCQYRKQCIRLESSG